MTNNRAWVIPLSKIPHGMTVHRYILETTNLNQEIDKFSDYKIPDYLKLPIHLDFLALEKSMQEAISLYGLYGFNLNTENSPKKDPAYLSASLTWNPHAIDKISDNPHQATLGSTIHKSGSASFYDGIVESGGNTYIDSYAFKEKTPFANHGEIKNVLDTFKRTLIRARVSTLVAGKEESTRMNFSWHNDEPLFMNLRVNIPIQTTPNYGIQIIKDVNATNLEMIEFELQKNFAYVYDTRKNHRAFCKKLDTVDRINMICGVSPWFDFNEEEQAWISNEFYGKMHPFEMFSEGHITSLVKEAGKK